MIGFDDVMGCFDIVIGVAIVFSVISIGVIVVSVIIVRESGPNCVLRTI